MKRLNTLPRTALVAALVAVTGLTACSTTSPDVVRREDANRLSTVQEGTVLSVRNVKVEGQQSGIGGTAGAVAGAVAGSSLGGRREGIVGGVLGAVAGAVAGNALERATTNENAVEILIQLRNGERRSVVQAQGDQNLQAGDPVIITTTGGKVRVSRAPVSAPRK